MGFLKAACGVVGGVVEKGAQVWDEITPDIGDIAEKAADAAKLPPVIGDAIALAIDFASGDYISAVADGCELVETLTEPPPPPSGYNDTFESLAERMGAMKKSEGTAPELLELNVTDEKVPSSRVDSTKPSSSTEKTTEEIVAELNQKSDKELMTMLREGKIPKEVKEDPLAMLALQKRLEEYQRMVQLMTNMLQTLHEMQMGIIRNVRA
jgi:hypothetical protein